MGFYAEPKIPAHPSFLGMARNTCFLAFFGVGFWGVQVEIRINDLCYVG